VPNGSPAEWGATVPNGSPAGWGATVPNGSPAGWGATVPSALSPGAESGLTLIEILTVLMLAAMVLSVVVVSAGGMMGTKLTATASKLGAMARYTYDLSSLHGKMHRLVIDIDGGEYYVEEMEPPKECSTNLEEDEEKEKERARRGGKEGADEEEAAGKTVTDMRIRKEKLPGKVRFTGVMTRRNKKVVEAGKESVHFFPDGTAEKAFIWLSDGEQVFTVEVKALQGTGVVFKEELDARDLEKR